MPWQNAKKALIVTSASFKPPVNGAELSHHGQLFAGSVLRQLILDIRLNLVRILTRRVDIAAPAPELLVPVFELKLRILLINVQAALSLQIADE